jgi:hypothetical protein
MDDILMGRAKATISGNELSLGIKPSTSIQDAIHRAEVTRGRLGRLPPDGARRATLDCRVTGPVRWPPGEGASQITGRMGVDRLEASESGTSMLTLSGRADFMNFDVAGISQLHGSELRVK